MPCLWRSAARIVPQCLRTAFANMKGVHILAKNYIWYSTLGKAFRWARSQVRGAIVPRTSGWTSEFWSQKNCDGNCDGRSDLGVKTDFIDTFGPRRINNLRVINTGRVHPAYRLVRQLLICFLPGRLSLPAGIRTRGLGAGIRRPP